MKLAQAVEQLQTRRASVQRALKRDNWRYQNCGSLRSLAGVVVARKRH